MKDVLKRFNKWRERNGERFLAKWALKRQKGKSHYVSGFALFWCLSMTALYALLSYIFGDYLTFAHVTVRLILNFLTGLLIGHFSWESFEKAYLNNLSNSENQTPRNASVTGDQH